MSSALGGAGGGGLLNTEQSTNANVAVYSSPSQHTFIHTRIALTLELSLRRSRFLRRHDLQSSRYQGLSGVRRLWICLSSLRLFRHGTHWQQCHGLDCGSWLSGRSVGCHAMDRSRSCDDVLPDGGHEGPFLLGVLDHFPDGCGHWKHHSHMLELEYDGRECE